MSTTIAEALSRATERLRATSPSARLDAELLLAHTLGWTRARLLAEGRGALPDGAQAALDALLERRAALEPVAYIVGRREFYGLEFVVDRRVLVPRPETELLVELALAAARRRAIDLGRLATGQAATPGATQDAEAPAAIADIGTGSGCIAVALAVHLPAARVYAVDASADALAVARINAERHGVLGRVTLLQGDLLAPLPGPVDLLVSNPPYTLLGEVDEGVRRHEPHLALDGGPDGLDAYRRLLAQAPPRLAPGGAVLLEIGAWQGAAVTELARAAFPRAEVALHADLAGRDRVVTIVTG